MMRANGRRGDGMKTCGANAKSPGAIASAGAFRMWLRELDLNQRPSGYEPDELPDCSTPRQSWCKIIRPRPRRVNRTLRIQTPQSGGLLIWYRGGDSNPYSLWPLPPQGSVSTNSTTSAETFLLLLFRSRRYITCAFRRLGLLLKYRHIVSGRCFLLLLLQDCRIGQTDVLQSIRLLFSEVR